MGIETDIHAALMARVEAMSLTPELVVTYPADPVSQAAEFLRVTHLPNVPNRREVREGGATQYLGILQLDLMSPFGRHEVFYIKRADSIAAHFAPDLKMTSGAAVVDVWQSYRLGGRSTGDHWMTPLRIEYRARSA